MRARERGDLATERLLYRSAIEHFEVAVSGSAPRLEALVNYAALCTRRGEHDLAESLLRRAIEQDPTSFEANHGLARTLLALDRADAALPFARTAIDSAGSPERRTVAEALRDAIRRRQNR